MQVTVHAGNADAGQVAVQARREMTAMLAQAEGRQRGALWD
jgi:hypothetical protein